MQYRKGTASGKLILLGEHGVLSGGVGITIPLPLTACRFSFKPAADSEWQISSKVPHRVLISLAKDWHWITKDTLLANKPFKFELEWLLPAQAGFGLSAAWSVSLVRAVRGDLKWSESKCLDALQQLEDGHHGGKASGLDHLTIWREQPQKFQAGKISPWELEPSWLKDLVIFSTGLPIETTAEMIQKSRPYADSLEVDNSALKCSDALAFRELINDYGRRLEGSALVNPRVAAKFEDFRTQGGAVKISGAGGYKAGSGAALAWHEDKNRLRDFVSHFTVIH